MDFVLFKATLIHRSSLIKKKGNRSARCHRRSGTAAKQQQVKKQVRLSQLISDSLQNEGGSGRLLLGNPGQSPWTTAEAFSSSGGGASSDPERQGQVIATPTQAGSFLTHLDLGGVPQVRLLSVVLG